MSIRLVNAIFAGHDAIQYSGSDLAVLVRLALFASDDGQNVYPSMSRIAKDVRLSVAQARRAVHKLERDGWLIKVGERRVFERNYYTNEYRIAVERLTFTPSVDATPRIDVRGNTHARLPLAPMQDNPLIDPLVDLYTGEPEERDQGKEPKKDEVPKKKRKPIDYPEYFETFWKAYPQRAGDQGDKKKSLGFYKKHIASGYTHAEILAGLQRYSAYVDAEQQRGTSLVKQVDTFLSVKADPPHFTKPWALPKQRRKPSDDFTQTDYGKLPQPGWAETA